MKIISDLGDRFEIRRNQDAMLIGNYYRYPKFYQGYGIAYWRDSRRVMIANDNRFEGL